MFLTRKKTVGKQTGQPKQQKKRRELALVAGVLASTMHYTYYRARHSQRSGPANRCTHASATTDHTKRLADTRRLGRLTSWAPVRVPSGVDTLSS